MGGSVEYSFCVRFDDLDVETKRRDEMVSQNVAEHAIEAKRNRIRESPQKSERGFDC